MHLAMNPDSLEPPVIAVGKKVILRDRLPSDVESALRWRTTGEWRFYDAPWEGVETSLRSEQEAEFRQHFLEKCGEELPNPRKSALIITNLDYPIGWVTRYGENRFPDCWMVGIDICEDEFLEKGLGQEALRLWVGYLFANSIVHRIGLDTWSFNRRMVRVAEKVGFLYEGAQRQMIQWQGEWLDLIHFGMTRSEWEA